MATAPLSAIQRDILIEHLDGRPVTLIRPPVGHDADKDRRARIIWRHTIQALLTRGFLETRKADKWRMETVITEAGRAALARELAQWADKLWRALDATSEPPRRTSEAFRALLESITADLPADGAAR